MAGSSVDSYYARTIEETRRYPALESDLEVEVVVIGGGLAGTGTALALAERGKRVALIEAHQVGWGASGRNGGFASEGFPNGYETLAARVGVEKARRYQAISRRGLELVAARIAQFDIRCGPLQTGALRCSLVGSGEEAKRHQAYMAETFDIHYDYWPNARLREALSAPLYRDALFIGSTIAVHPLNLACGMARACAETGVQVFEGTPALGLIEEPGRKAVRTPKGTITADAIVIACGGYVAGLERQVSGATIPIASFVMATEPLGEHLRDAVRVPYAIFDNTVAVNYYRPLADTRMLWGGRVLAWEPSPDRIAALLKRDMVKFYPALADAKVEVAWGGMMPFTRHKFPVVGQVKPGLWYATGFGGLGVTLTSALGELIARGIAEDDDEWRMFEAFGLAYAGGAFGKVPAQLYYWMHQAKAALGMPSAH